MQALLWIPAVRGTRLCGGSKGSRGRRWSTLPCTLLAKKQASLVAFARVCEAQLDLPPPTRPVLAASVSIPPRQEADTQTACADRSVPRVPGDTRPRGPALRPHAQFQLPRDSSQRPGGTSAHRARRPPAVRPLQHRAQELVLGESIFQGGIQSGEEEIRAGKCTHITMLRSRGQSHALPRAGASLPGSCFWAWAPALPAPTPRYTPRPSEAARQPSAWVPVRRFLQPSHGSFRHRSHFSASLSRDLRAVCGPGEYRWVDSYGTPAGCNLKLAWGSL